MNVTKGAARLIADRVHRSGDGEGGFRIRRDDDQEFGQLLIGYVHSPMPDDAVVKAGRARVFIAQDAKESVDPFTLDVREVGSEQHLYLRDRAQGD